MSHRVGICSSCEANYKVPADFAADKAKCKQCGGVVEVGAVVDDTPQPPPPVPAMPVRKAEPKIEEHIPSGKKGGGPSMMERLLAEREAQRTSEGGPAKQTKATSKATTTPSSKASTSPRRKAASGDGPPKGKASSRRAAPSRSSRRRGTEDEGDEEEEGTTRRSRSKKKSPVPLICTLGLLLIGGGAGIYFVFMQDDNPSEEEQVAKADTDAATDDPSVDQAMQDTNGEDPAQSDEDGTIEETTDTATDPADGASQEEQPKRTSNRKEKDPMEVDLAGLVDFGAPYGCDEDQWASLQEDASTLVDPLAGAQGGRAGRRLEAAGRFAIPALINVFKTRDMGTDAGYRDGDLLQRTLEKINNGKNFGWKYTTEPNDHWYNRKVVENHWKLWDKYQADEAGWLKFTGLDKEGVKPTSGGGEDDLSTDELDALDDI